MRDAHGCERIKLEGELLVLAADPGIPPHSRHEILGCGTGCWTVRVQELTCSARVFRKEERLRNVAPLFRTHVDPYGRLGPDIWARITALA